MLKRGRYLQSGLVHRSWAGFLLIAVFPLLTTLTHADISVTPKSVLSATSTDKQAVIALSTVLAKIKNMQANFIQNTKSPTNKVPVKAGQPLRSRQMGQTFSGLMQVKRPGQFRWEVTKPMKQLIVSNGKTVWIYDPDLAQVTRQALDSQIANTPALLLSGQTADILKSFRVLQIDKQKQLFQLYPTAKDGIFEMLSIEFDNDQPSAMVLTDTLGQETQIKFSNVKLNTAIDDGLFKFTPPKDVDVIDQ